MAGVKGSRILYVARGRGRGHALAGLAIAGRLTSIRPEVEVQFVSYGTGAATLREHGQVPIVLDLPDQPGFLDVSVAIAAVIEQAGPSLIVAHEEFEVIAVARLHGLPCVFVTDWFADPNDWTMQCLRHASQILFLDEPAVFAKPAYLSGKVDYTGPVLRPLRYQRQDRLRARQEAGLPQDAFVASVFIHPGRRTEALAPLSGLLKDAFERFEASPKLLLWDRDSDVEFDRIMAASDLIVTKGNRNIVLELAALGTPAISVSYGLNCVDDLRTSSLANNRTVPYTELNAARLASIMREMMDQDRARAIRPQPFQDGVTGAARQLDITMRQGLTEL